MSRKLLRAATLLVLTILIYMSPAEASAEEQKEIGPVDIPSITKYVEQDGWSWDPVTKTLTLAGVNMDGYLDYTYTENPDHEGTGDYYLFRLPYGSTVHVKEGTVNKLYGRYSGNCFNIMNRKVNDTSDGVIFTGGGTLEMHRSEICIYSESNITFKDLNIDFIDADIPIMTDIQPYTNDDGTTTYKSTMMTFDNVDLSVQNCTGGLYTYGDYARFEDLADGTVLPTSSITIKDSVFDMNVILDEGNERNHSCFLIRNGDLTIESSTLNLNAYHPAVIVWKQYHLNEDTTAPLINITDSIIENGIEITGANTEINNSIVHAETFVNAGETTSFSFGADGDMSFDHTFTNSLNNVTIKAIPKYTVTFDTLGGSIVSGITVMDGNKIGTLPLPTKFNCTFIGWSTVGGATSANVTADTVVTSDITLYAVWKNDSVIPNKDVTGSSGENDITSTKQDETDNVPNKTEETTTLSNRKDETTAISNTANKENSTSPVNNKTFTEKEVEKRLLAANTDKEDPVGSKIGKLMLKASGKKKSVKLTWKKVSGATSYVIYGNKCGSKMKKLKTVSAKKSSYTFKKLNKGKYYKYIIVAYKKVNGTNTAIATSKSVHCATNGGKYGNPAAIKGVKNTIKIKVGKTKKIKPILKKSKKVKTHIAKFRYESSKPKVAKVSKKGIITGIKKGSCTVYVYAQNGVCKKIKVKVSK